MVFKVRGERLGVRGKGRIFLFLSLIFFLSLIPNPLSLSLAKQIDYTQDLTDFINTEMKPWVNNDIVIDNLNKQNEASAGYSESNLKIMDNNWRSEIRKVNQPLVSQVLASDLSQFLKKKLEESQGVLTQLKILDAKGLNIAQTVISNDCWNVGKPIWDSTFKVKNYAPYISEVYFSEETNKFQVDVSFVIAAADEAIGIISGGIDVEQLEDWKKRRK